MELCTRQDLDCFGDATLLANATLLSASPASILQQVILGASYVNSPKSSDVKFIVEGRPFFAHRIALLASSEIFKTMFDGEAAAPCADTCPIERAAMRHGGCRLRYHAACGQQRAPEPTGPSQMPLCHAASHVHWLLPHPGLAGHYREKDASTIPIPNIRWEVFEKMMHCVYTGAHQQSRGGRPPAPLFLPFSSLPAFAQHATNLNLPMPPIDAAISSPVPPSHRQD